MSTILFSEQDRDENGFIRLSPPAPAAPATEQAPPAPTKARRPAPARRPIAPAQRKTLAIGGGALLAVVLVALTVYATPSRPMAEPAARHALATSAPAFVPEPSPLPTAAPARTLGAYAAPDGTLLGTIEATRAITPVAHYDSDWIQADVSGSGRVWLRAADLPGVALSGPDLAPKAALEDERPPVAPPAAWNAPAAAAPIAEAVPTLPPTVFAAAMDAAANGQRPDLGGWCSGSHLDNPECGGARDTAHGQREALP